MIKGVTVQLKVKTQTGTDGFGAPVYSATWEDVENVLVGEPSTDEVVNTTTIYGKHLAYMLAIPKGDTHDWSDTEVILPAPFSGRFRTIGLPIMGIEANIPLAWNAKVRLERYE